MAEPRRLDVDLLNVPDAILAIDGTDYLIRGSALFGDHLLKLVEIETRLLSAKGDEERELAGEASAVITELVRIETPEAPELDLNPVQALAIFAHVVGADSVTTALVDALQAGLQGLDEDAVAALIKQQAESEGADDGPLAQGKRSSGGSSRSAKRTSGGRNGGRAAAGARAGSTSRARPKSS